MAKDYARISHKQGTSRKRGFVLKPWSVLLFLVLLTIPLSIGLYIALEAKGVKPISAPPSTPVRSAIPQKPPESTHFDFYTLLPQSSGTSAPQTTPSHYLIQLASTPDSEKVKTLTATLSALGFKANVIPIERGQTLWYRVQLGPFGDRASAEEKQEQLSAHHIQGLIVGMTRET